MASTERPLPKGTRSVISHKQEEEPMDTEETRGSGAKKKTSENSRRKTGTPPSTPPRQNKQGLGETVGNTAMTNYKGGTPSTAMQHFDGGHENQRLGHENQVTGYGVQQYSGNQYGTNVDGKNWEYPSGNVPELVRQHEMRLQAPSDQTKWEKIKSGFSTAVSYLPGVGRKNKPKVSENQPENQAENQNTAFANSNLQGASFEGSQFIIGPQEKVLPPDPLDGYGEQDFLCHSFSAIMNETSRGFLVKPKFSWKLRPIPKNTQRQDFGISISLLNHPPVVEQPFPAETEKCVVLHNKIQCGKSYVMKISFYVVSARSELFCETEFRFSTKPGKPSYLALHAKQDYACLKWSACDGATQIEIKVYSTSGDLLQTFLEKGTATSCNISYDDNIVMGIYCKFQVNAKFAEVENKSEMKTIFIGDKNCPRLVRANLIKATNKVKVTWEAPNTSVSSYNIKAECPGVKMISKNTQSKEFEFEGLTAGSKYTFSVQAAFMFSFSSFWIPSNSITTASCTIEVQNFEAELNPEDPGTSIICKWAENSDAECCKIKCSSDDHESLSVVTRGNKFIIQNLYPDTKYKVKIRAKEIRGYGDYGYPVELTTALGQVSHPLVTLLSASRDDDSMPGVRVQFFSSPFPLRKCKKEHIVELRTPGQEPISTAVYVEDQLKYDVKFSGLKHSTEYEAFVKSSCDEKFGEEVFAGKIITVPKIPEKVHCNVDENSLSDTFCIKWNGELESVDYEIYVSCIDENEAVLIPPNEKELHVYKCQNDGCAYEVKIRAYNASGYSQWSPTKVIITAPAAVDDARMAFEDKVIVVSWDATRHTAEYDVDLFEVNDDDDTDLLDDEKNKLVYSRNVKNKSEATHPIDEVLEDFKPRKGVVYQCRITTKNASGVGISKKSKKFISPLDPPTDITYQQKEDTVLLEWKPSVGMKKAKIVVKQGEDHDYQDIVTEDFWTSPPLLPDRHVEIRIYAKNSSVESEEFGQKKFYTAPSLIVADLDPTYRSTYMNVDITSNTDGRYRVHIESLNGDHLDEFETTNLQCQVTDLHPATEYAVVVQNVSDDPEEICLDSHAERVTTDPLQITGLKCEIVDEQQKLLSWDSCGNDQIGYTVECRKDMAVMTTTTTETKMLLESLEPGRYSFLVKGGQGEFSKPYNITVPESPKFEVELLTPEQISVICSQVKYADNYEAEIWCDGNRRDNFATINGKFRIQHAFECAKLYLLKLYAVCKQHKSEVAKHHFYANLTAATNLCYKLDNKQPSKKIRFTWETDDLTLKSHLKLSDCNENVIGEVITVEKEWEFGDLVPNREYTLKAYPNDGVRSYTNYAEVKFRTVPSKPDKLEIKKNRFHPETMFDVEIHADYNGPFMILVKKANEKEGQEIEKDSKRFTLDNMIPGCPYCFFVRCKFIDPVNEIEYYSAYTPFTGKK